MTEPAILAVDDEPEMPKPVERDLRKHFAADRRFLKAGPGPEQAMSMSSDTLYDCSETATLRGRYVDQGVDRIWRGFTCHCSWTGTTFEVPQRKPLLLPTSRILGFKRTIHVGPSPTGSTRNVGPNLPW